MLKINDKQTECMRYDKRAQSLLAAEYAAEASSVETAPDFGSLSAPPIYRAPYIYYEQCIQKYVKQDHHVLELGSGTGLHTYALVQTGARVVTSDISENSLAVLSRRFERERERESKNPGCRHGNTSV
jgi:SAM-dependent methyltransferase